MILVNNKFKLSAISMRAGMALAEGNYDADGLLKEIIQICEEETMRHIEVLIYSVNFEENTLTVKLPEDFWEKHKITPGTTTITLGNGLWDKNDKIEPLNRIREFLDKQQEK